eukprot:6457801-Pyramimonas_sp.AAC.1
MAMQQAPRPHEAPIASSAAGQEVRQDIGELRICMKSAAPDSHVVGSFEEDMGGHSLGGVAPVGPLSLSAAASGDRRQAPPRRRAESAGGGASFSSTGSCT